MSHNQNGTTLEPLGKHTTTFNGNPTKNMVLVGEGRPNELPIAS